MPSPPSPVSSGSTSQFEQEPDLPQLVSYFVSAKRSILSTSHRIRANEIVNTARALLEENVILAAKNAYIQKSVEEQMVTLEAIHYGISLAGSETWAALLALLATLDSSTHRLEETLRLLKHTEISPKLQTSEKKALFDFIDITNYTELAKNIHGCIDRVREAKDELGSVEGRFEDSMQSLRQDLTSVTSTPFDEPVSPLPPTFRELEIRAQELAHNLQSLVHHYDLCVTALKHTEGGLPAASEATGDVPKAQGVSVESLHQDDALAPMSTSERRDLLSVIAKDAAEVEEVTAEMRDHATEMEEGLSSMSSYVAQLRHSHDVLLSAVRSLHAVDKEIRPYITSARTFLRQWEDERVKIEQGIEDVESFKEFYDTFLSAYDGVLHELQRRQKADEEGEQIATEFEARVAKLYEDDLTARAAFRDQFGEYIPRDLWPGVVDLPPRYKIIIVPEEREDEPAPAVQQMEGTQHEQ